MIKWENIVKAWSNQQKADEVLPIPRKAEEMEKEPVDPGYDTMQEFNDLAADLGIDIKRIYWGMDQYAVHTQFLKVMIWVMKNEQARERRIINLETICYGTVRAAKGKVTYFGADGSRIEMDTNEP